MLTIQQILDIAKISLWLALNDISKGVMYGGKLDPLLGRKIYMEYSSLEWMYAESPSDTTLRTVANYVYELCGSYALQAQIILNIGNTGGAVINGNSGGNVYPFVITSSDFENDGVSYNNPNIVGDNIILFINEFSQQWLVSGAGYFSYTPTGFIITIDGFDANIQSYTIIVQEVFNSGVTPTPPTENTLLINSTDSLLINSTDSLLIS